MSLGATADYVVVVVLGAVLAGVGVVLAVVGIVLWTRGPRLSLEIQEPLVSKKATDDKDEVWLVTLPLENDGDRAEYEVRLEGLYAATQPLRDRPPLYWQNEKGKTLLDLMPHSPRSVAVADISPDESRAAFVVRIKDPSGEEYGRSYEPADDRVEFRVVFREANTGFETPVRIHCWRDGETIRVRKG